MTGILVYYEHGACVCQKYPLPLSDIGLVCPFFVSLAVFSRCCWWLQWCGRSNRLAGPQDGERYVHTSFIFIYTFHTHHIHGYSHKVWWRETSRHVRCFPNVVMKSFMVKLMYTIKTTVSAESLWCFVPTYAMLIIVIRGSGEPISFDSTHLKQR